MDDRVIWWNGRLVPWRSAQVHVTSETALRGLNVFEGIRACWRPNTGEFALVGFEQHLRRLSTSAQLMQIPVTDAVDTFRRGVAELLSAIPCREDLYLRPTIYVETGAYERDPVRTRTGYFISWRSEPIEPFAALSCGVSTWLRIPTRCLPADAKIGAVYTAFRLARLEVLSRGCDEAILLNDAGRVTEAGGGSIFCVVGTTVVTPPLEEGILPSITRRIVIETICPACGFDVQQRPIAIAELRLASSVFIAGTLCGISRVSAIDNEHIPDQGEGSPVFRIQDMYRRLLDGADWQESDWVELMSVEGR